MIKHIKSPGIVKTVHSSIFEHIQGYSGYLGTFTDIDAYSATLKVHNKEGLGKVSPATF